MGKAHGWAFVPWKGVIVKATEPVLPTPGAVALEPLVAQRSLDEGEEDRCISAATSGRQQVLDPKSPSFLNPITMDALAAAAGKPRKAARFDFGSLLPSQQPLDLTFEDDMPDSEASFLRPKLSRDNEPDLDEILADWERQARVFSAGWEAAV
ncbi:hypothetical protein AK812_SmicGene611 [Symbiodinium microadriaticum]|uniref:Uncharacterized protein n=1 Tax=Symbiodinium microadriaticum TaxID=2951 RepID=A0A1Q9F689_SYMMI|nr:hypothetical protein AK812_SmicGene611 [Symbiodinium microadriaticum]